MKKPRISADERYMQLVKENGLFGKAFFGHRKTKQEARKLNSLWKQVMHEYKVKEPPATEVKRVHRASEDEGNLGHSDQVSPDTEGSA